MIQTAGGTRICDRLGVGGFNTPLPAPAKVSRIREPIIRRRLVGELLWGAGRWHPGQGPSKRMEVGNVQVEGRLGWRRSCAHRVRPAGCGYGLTTSTGAATDTPFGGAPTGFPAPGTGNPPAAEEEPGTIPGTVPGNPAGTDPGAQPSTGVDPAGGAAPGTLPSAGFGSRTAARAPVRWWFCWQWPA